MIITSIAIIVIIIKFMNKGFWTSKNNYYYILAYQNGIF